MKLKEINVNFSKEIEIRKSALIKITREDLDIIEKKIPKSIRNSRYFYEEEGKIEFYSKKKRDLGCDCITVYRYGNYLRFVRNFSNSNNREFTYFEIVN